MELTPDLMLGVRAWLPHRAGELEGGRIGTAAGDRRGRPMRRRSPMRRMILREDHRIRRAVHSPMATQTAAARGLCRRGGAAMPAEPRLTRRRWPVCLPGRAGTRRDPDPWRYGFSRLPVERPPRCPGLPDLRGTSDIQRLIIARERAKSYTDRAGIAVGRHAWLFRSSDQIGGPCRAGARTKGSCLDRAARSPAGTSTDGDKTTTGDDARWSASDYPGEDDGMGRSAARWSNSSPASMSRSRPICWR
jgi:hypothetical protein